MDLEKKKEEEEEKKKVPDVEPPIAKKEPT